MEINCFGILEKYFNTRFLKHLNYKINDNFEKLQLHPFYIYLETNFDPVINSIKLINKKLFLNSSNVLEKYNDLSSYLLHYDIICLSYDKINNFCIVNNDEIVTNLTDCVSLYYQDKDSSINTFNQYLFLNDLINDKIKLEQIKNLKSFVQLLCDKFNSYDLLDTFAFYIYFKDKKNAALSVQIYENLILLLNKTYNNLELVEKSDYNLEINNKYNDLLKTIYNNIGNIYRDISNKDKSLYYFEKSKNYEEILKLFDYDIKNNIVLIYFYKIMERNNFNYASIENNKELKNLYDKIPDNLSIKKLISLKKQLKKM